MTQTNQRPLRDVSRLPQPPKIDGRLPPHAMDIERSLLGAIMLDPNALELVLDMVRPEHFYADPHARIYAAIASLATAGAGVDAMTVAEALTRDGRIKQVGGKSYLLEIVETTQVVQNARDYAKTVIELARLRVLIATCQRVTAEGYGPVGNVHEFIETAAEAVASVAQTDLKTTAIDIVSAMGNAMEKALRDADAPGTVAGISTGIRPIDDVTGGLHRGEVVLLLGRSGGGKMLSLDTPLATPDGWTTMGDVRPGDVIFAVDGSPAKVLAVSPVSYGKQAYEVVFSDGATIVADAGHLWETSTHPERTELDKHTPEGRAGRRAKRAAQREVSRAALGATNKRPEASAAASARTARLEAAGAFINGPRSGIRTTEEILETLRTSRGESNHHVRCCEPLRLPSADLPIDPYVLGVWLGDGTSNSGHVTKCQRDVEVIERARQRWPGGVWSQKKHQDTWCFGGLQVALRQLGVLGNKHIPAVYLRASFDQRMELIRGIMDTDGGVEGHGSCSFTTTTQALRDGMAELLVSVGIKTRPREGRAVLRGVDCGPKWVFKFVTALPMFTLHRKVMAQKLTGFRGTHSRRYIIDVRPIPPIPMRCIEIDHDSHLYLAGKEMIPTHNSSLTRQIGANIAKTVTTLQDGSHMIEGVFIAMADTMTAEQIAMAMACCWARVDENRVRTKRMVDTDEFGNVVVDHWPALLNAAGWVGALPVFVHADPKLTVAATRTELRLLRARLAKSGWLCPVCGNGKRCPARISLVVYDTAQVFATNEPERKPGEKLIDKMDRVGLGAAETAKQFDSAVIVISQLNKEDQAWGGPQLKTHAQTQCVLKTSKAKPKRDSSTTRDGDPASLFIEKQRHGPSEISVPLWFQPKFTRFEE